jgi:2,3-bisphosphoglycerate-independent phosphoglycerate mutase
MNNTKKPIVLCILDGWGHRESAEHNAILEANAPFLKKLYEYPHCLLETSGLAVGLPEGQMGNSEVGHMNIGSGRVVMQSLPQIDLAILDDSLARKPELSEQIALLKKNGKTCHILGLVSDGGVHSHQNHIVAIAKIVAAHGINVCIHAFTDGRDTPPASGVGFMQKLEDEISGFSSIKIATVSGRYYAMDRDNRWERVELAYNAIAEASGQNFPSSVDAIKASYANGKNDEFVLPCVISDYSGMQDGDGIIMANFRADRARQTLAALLDPEFSSFKRNKIVKFTHPVGITEYSVELNKFIHTIFKPAGLNNILGEVIANSGLTQLRIAETEKYAHVTFFFNGGREEVFFGEERILVPSPKVATYDLQPEMSAVEITDKLVAAIDSGKFDLLVVNYANTDMVGHTGFEDAAIKAVETVSKCLKRLVALVAKHGGKILITADHGNAEQMVDDDGCTPHTAHTTNPVPLIIAGSDVAGIKLRNGRLCDIAPTILQLMSIKQPDEMTGESLIK